MKRSTYEKLAKYVHESDENNKELQEIWSKMERLTEALAVSGDPFDEEDTEEYSYSEMLGKIAYALRDIADDLEESIDSDEDEAPCEEEVNKGKEEFIAETTPRPALYEMLAEESVELALAALKVARIMRKENPTPMSLHAASINLIEELSDVTLVSDVLNLEPDEMVMDEKRQRWFERIVVED